MKPFLDTTVSFVPLIKAYNTTEALRIRLLLDRTRVHYMVKNEGVQNLIGGGAAITGYNPATGPIEFHVLASEKEELESMMEELFSLHAGDIPEFCPACEHPSEGKMDCPHCGLFLG